MNKRIIALLAAIVLLAGTTTAFAGIPGDWRAEIRNEDDTEYIPLNIPTRATSTHALLGGNIGEVTAAWYVLTGGLKANTVATNKYEITIDPGLVDGLSVVALSGSYNDLTHKPTIGKAYEGTTLRNGSFPIYKNATVSSGTAVFHLTADGNSGGTALCTNGIIQDSIDVEVNDSAASYQMSYALSNSNKTVTVTANRLTTANILTGILGQTQANGAVVRLVATCY